MATMQDLADLLGVEIGEEFFIDNGDNEMTCIIDPVDGLCRKFGDQNFQRVNSILPEIIMGEYKIIKKPWKPTRGDSYFQVNIDGSTSLYTWEGSAMDLADYAVGNCFRTRAEAEKNKDKIINYLRDCYEKGSENDKRG